MCSYFRQMLPRLGRNIFRLFRLVEAFHNCAYVLSLIKCINYVKQTFKLFKVSEAKTL